MAWPDRLPPRQALQAPNAFPALSTRVIRRSLRPSFGDPFAGDDAAPAHPACFRAQGRGRFLPSPSDGCTLLVTLRGALDVDSIDGTFRLGRRQFLCLPNTSLLRVLAGPRADWVALRLPQSCVQRLAQARLHAAVSTPWLLPVPLPASRALIRALADLLRCAADSAAQARDGLQVAAVLLQAIEVQLDSLDWVRRAYGRSERHRRSVVVRLLSARNRIVNAPFVAHDLAGLAAAARYSPSHFLRSFRDVFGMTPRELVTESRMAMARDLIRGSDLAIHEIASNVGYESRHAFSRLFKRENGATASDYRCAAGGTRRG